jgi:hypothetical protein
MSWLNIHRHTLLNRVYCMIYKLSRTRISSSSSDSTSWLTTPTHERRLFISTAPRTNNPRCIYPSPVPAQGCHRSRATTRPIASITWPCAARAASRASRACRTILGSRIYDPSSSDSDYDQLPSTRFRDRNVKRGSRMALDRLKSSSCWSRTITALVFCP